MTDQKIDWPPLLPEGGLHPFDLSRLRALTVDEFPGSHRRPGLFISLEVYLELLEATGLRASIWIDGSFMCSKIEPEDIDLVIVYDADQYDALPEETQDTIDRLMDTDPIRAQFWLHVHDVPEDDEKGRAYWLQKFGTQRDEITPKGLAELRINK